MDSPLLAKALLAFGRISGGSAVVQVQISLLKQHW